jgi:serine/threonine protein kinase
MGEVYKARDLRLNRFVAIKVLPAEHFADPNRKQRFVNEARAASALNHPNIVSIFDIASEDGRDYIVMEYIVGATLDALVCGVGMPIVEVLNIALQVAEGLSKAHEVGIIHRDLKPSNIMITRDGLVKILDFGLAKLKIQEEVGQDDGTQTIVPETMLGNAIGTPSYMSPEQAEGKKLDARSDLFSFGAVLYEMASGRRAFSGESKASTMAAVLNHEPVPVGELVRGVPKQFESIVARSLRKDPARRWQHANDLKIALEDLKKGSFSQAPRGWVPLGRALSRRSSIFAAAVVTAIAGLIWWYTAKPTTPEKSLLPVPLTSYAGSEMQPDFSPDGNQVVFIWDGETGGHFDVYVTMVGSGSPHRLTTSPGSKASPAWSRDGRWIAFLRQTGNDQADLLLTSALGGPERKLTQIRFRHAGVSSSLGRLSWSPDGLWVATSDREQAGAPPAIFLVSVETGEKRKLTSPDQGFDFNPAFSPDGKTIAFCRYGGNPITRIFGLELSAERNPKGEPRPLTPLASEPSDSPTWTEDGREIVYEWRVIRPQQPCRAHSEICGSAKLVAGILVT